MFGLFEGWDPDDVGLIKAVALDFGSLLFVYVGYRLARAAKKKQDIYSENNKSSEVKYSEILIWIITFVYGLFFAYNLPTIFHKEVICRFVYDCDYGPFTALARYALCLCALYIMVRAPRSALQVGVFGLVIVLPIILVAGHYAG